jgi:3-hydroxyisobutyrate dehydrogenase-like beta-hydroxyacid dehydrogenase
MNWENEVSVIGLGAMGSALARALLRGGHSVTVWNRTRAKAESLIEEGANLATNLPAAIVASPVTIVCVDSYEVTRSILSAPKVRSNLAGQVLVQLSTGTPNDARDGEQWAKDNGAAYLDGSIMAYPEHMGTPEAGLLVAGEDVTFQQCEPLLRCVAGGLVYVGQKIGAAAALDCATLSMLFGAVLGTIHGARICEVEGLRVDEFGAMATDFLPVLGGQITHLCERIQSNSYDDSPATLGTYAAAATLVMQQAQESQMNTKFPAFAAEVLGKGVQAGFGAEDLAALVKYLRTGA